MLKRPAFLTLTVCTVALYVIHNTHNISRNTFRGLVLLIFMSVIYDFLCIFIIEPSAADEDAEDGGNEWKLRRFVRLVTFISFFWKALVALIFWKDSLDFSRIVRKKAAGGEAELAAILA